MHKLEKLCCYVKAVLATTISEKVVQKLEREAGYDCCRGALDLCWEWIERKDSEKCDPWDLCVYLDDEEGIDLLYYAETEKEGKVYDIVLGTVSYIASLQFREKKAVYPQYLGGIIENGEYYRSIISDAIAMEECSYEEVEIDKIIDYCNTKLEENSKYMFCKTEIEEMFLK